MSYPACSSRLRTMSAGRSVGARTRSVGAKQSTMKFAAQDVHGSHLSPSPSSATYVAPPQGPITTSCSVVASTERRLRRDHTARHGTSCSRGISGRYTAPCCPAAASSACALTSPARSRPMTSTARSDPRPPFLPPNFLALSTMANPHLDMHALHGPSGISFGHRTCEPLAQAVPG